MHGKSLAPREGNRPTREGKAALNAELVVFLGYDSREDVAWRVANHSLHRHASRSLHTEALRQDILRAQGLYYRPTDPGASTEFSLTRFLAPALSEGQPWTLFMDSDMVLTGDIYRVFDHIGDGGKAVYVVKHRYSPQQHTKKGSFANTPYPRKNWSSLMLFNNKHPAVKCLSPEVVNTASPAFLHRFEWLSDDDIGTLPIEFNFLVGDYAMPASLPLVLHFTNGGPWLLEYKDSDYAQLWRDEHKNYEESLERNLN